MITEYYECSNMDLAFFRKHNGFTYIGYLEDRKIHQFSMTFNSIDEKNKFEGVKS